MIPDWIAIDWGTTNLRVWAMTGRGEVLAEASSDQGMANVQDGRFEAALLDLIDDWLGGSKTTLAIAAGMVGARQGWVEAPYSSVPSGGDDPELMIRVPVSDTRLDLRILPGVCQLPKADVMRGEETQILGFLSAHPGFEGLICLPGTHSKWVRVAGNRILGFHTAMTGELFALLSEQSVLKHSMTEGHDDAAFLAGVREAMAAPERLTASLFSIRAESLLRDVPDGAGRSYLSGLLIGAELAAADLDDQDVALIGSGSMIDLYRHALAAINVVPIEQESGIAARAGLHQAYLVLTGEKT